MSVQSFKIIPTPNYIQIEKNFLEELRATSNGKPSSLSFVSHLLSEKSLLTHGIVQGIVIGGTNYIVSTEEIAINGERRTLTRKTGTLPIFSTKHHFTNFLSEHIDSRADAIGINFGFKLKSTVGKNGELDGVVLAKGTKDHTFLGLNESIGTLTKTIFAEKYSRKVLVSVANDTISLLLAGKGDEQVSLIVGTGFNMGLRIKDKTLINLEAGNFNKFDHLEVLNEIDANTKNPGKKLFEKNVSGMYIAKHLNFWAERFGLMIPPVITGQEVSTIAHSYHDVSAKEIARIVLKQSAALIATVIAATYKFYNEPQIFTVIGEGGLLWDGWHYYENIMKQLKVMEIPTGTIAIKSIKDSGINGAIGLLIS